jgi:hypothetical protein
MEPISSPVRAVIDLFADPLRDVRFGEVDATTLAELAASVAAAAEVVGSTEAQLVRDRKILQERQEALLVQAQRALAYARVFAENDPPLMERLEQIALPRPPRRPRLNGEALVLEPDPPPRTRAPAEPVSATRRRSTSRKPEQDPPTLVPELTATG